MGAWILSSLALSGCAGGQSAETIDFGGTDSASAETSIAPTAEDTGEDTGSSSDASDSSTGASSDEPTLVPLSVEQREVDGLCHTRGSEERIAAVGPNAELWLAEDVDNGTHIRAVTVGGQTSLDFSTSGPLLSAVALDGDRGAFATPEGLFTVRGPRVDLLSWPSDPASIAGLCGDLSVDGDGRVFADDVFTRDLGQWWRWNAPEDVSGPAASMGMQAGACTDRTGAGFVLAGQTVWSVRPDFVETLPAFGPASAVVGHDAFGLASIVDGELRIGSPEQTPDAFVFEAGPATALAAGDDVLYVQTDAQVYALHDGTFVELTREGASLDAGALVGAGAGGVVLEGADQVCFRGPPAPIEVLGLRPAARRRTADLDITVRSAAAGVQATLDGTAVVLDAEVDGTLHFAAEQLDEGWHTFEVSHEDTRRVFEFSVERLTPATWAEDIVPLFEAHCSGAGCHGPVPASDDRPDLSEYDVWVDLAETIRNRVGVSADMPPPGASDWGVEQTLIVLGWLDAGLPEGE